MGIGPLLTQAGTSCALEIDVKDFVPAICCNAMYRAISLHPSMLLLYCTL
jgi:hypothetical protein